MIKSYAEFRVKLLQKINKNRPIISIADDYIFNDLNETSLCIDLGAHVGKVTTKFRERGCKVICFEPNPATCKVIQEKFSGDDRVQIINAAASDRNGTTKIFANKAMTDLSSTNDLSQSFSMVAAKVNVTTDSYVETPAIDIGEFVNNLPSKVDFMKMDVEGYEVNLLWRLIKTGAIYKIKRLYVETHEEKVPGLFFKLLIIKAYLKLSGIKSVNFDWN